MTNAVLWVEAVIFAVFVAMRLYTRICEYAHGKADERGRFSKSSTPSSSLYRPATV